MPMQRKTWVKNRESPEAAEAVYRRYCDARNQEDFETLVTQYRNLVYRIAYGVSGNAVLAEDVTQETFLKVAMAPQFEARGHGSFRAWLCMMSMNIARHQLRYEHCRRQRVQSNSELQETLPLNNSYGERDAEAGLSKEEDLRQMRQALSGLSEETRIPIILHFMEQMPQADIGKIIGVTQAQVSRRIATGLQLLKKRLESVGVYAVALPSLLSNADLLTSPPSLCSPEALHQAKLRMARQLSRQSVRNGAARVSYGGKVVLLVSVLAGCSALFWSLSPERISPQRSTQAQSDGRPLAKYVWKFDRTDFPTVLKVVTGRCVFHNGKDGNIGFETVDSPLIMEVDVPLENRVYALTMTACYIFKPGSDRAGFLGGGWTHRSDVAMFRNAGALPKVKQLADGKPFMSSTDTRDNLIFPSEEQRTFLAADCLDNWNESERSSITFMSRSPDSKIRVYVQGHYLLEKIELVECSPTELPDHALFRKALESVEPARRIGTVTIASIPPKRGHTHVMIEFSHE